MRLSVWTAVSPKRIKLAYHLSGSYDPLIPTVKVWIPTSHPGTLSEQVPQRGVLFRLVCVSVLKSERTPVIWPLELQDEETLLVPTYRQSVGPLPLGCCIDISVLILTFQMCVGHLVPGPLPVIYPFRWP